jgi:hypothetical protein
MDSSLRELLAAVSRGRDAGAARIRGLHQWAPGAGIALAQPPRAARPRNALDGVLPGREVRTTSGFCWVHERQLGRWPAADPLLPARLEKRLAEEPPKDLARDEALALWRTLGFRKGLFLDLETTGLSATPVFLAGLLKADDAAMTVTLIFARDYGEEKALLETVAAELEERPVAITYNGKSYDFPFLRERTGRLRVRRADPRIFDVLHAARRRWKSRLPDCRLKTLETSLCRRNRGPDVDGRLIPDIYHRYVRSGDPRELFRVFTHNVMDLYTLMEVTEKVLSCSVPTT